MKHIDETKKQQGIKKDPVDLVDILKPVEAKKSKDQVWADLEKMMEQPIQKEAKIKKLDFSVWRIAASILLLLSFTALGMRFYFKEVNCPPGEQKNATLPDGSTVQLNAKSVISFHPLWWRMKREVDLRGEAFFKVKKGEKFTVVSKNGETSVMGTSFNIFARDEDYEVTCLTGRVRVSSNKTRDEIIITPNQMATLNSSGKLDANLDVNAKLALGWTKGQFIFTQIPLRKVLSEISLRYGVAIKNTAGLNQLYTGSFIKEREIEPVLDLVCKPFDVEYKKTSSGEFTIQTP